MKTSSRATRQETLGHSRFSTLSLCGLILAHKSGSNVRELIATLKKKKKAQAGNESTNLPLKSSQEKATTANKHTTKQRLLIVRNWYGSVHLNRGYHLAKCGIPSLHVVYRSSNNKNNSMTAFSCEDFRGRFVMSYNGIKDFAMDGLTDE